MDRQRWSRLTLAEQLGNLVRELSRANHWQEQGDLPSRDRCLERALEIVDFICP